jgi:hypothetical protein
MAIISSVQSFSALAKLNYVFAKGMSLGIGVVPDFLPSLAASGKTETTRKQPEAYH